MSQYTQSLPRDSKERPPSPNLSGFSNPERTSETNASRLRVQEWMNDIPHDFPPSADQDICGEIGRLIEILYPSQSFDHIDLHQVHHLMKVCRNEAYFHLLAAEHRMMFFMQRLESSRRELEKVHSNYCRAVELLESGLDLPSQVDAEVGGDEELTWA